MLSTVVTELEAENATLWARAGWDEVWCCSGDRVGEERLRIEGRVAPAAAAVDADIEPDPIGNDAAGGRRGDRRRRPHRYVRR